MWLLRLDGPEAAKAEKGNEQESQPAARPCFVDLEFQIATKPRRGMDLPHKIRWVPSAACNATHREPLIGIEVAPHFPG